MLRLAESALHLAERPVRSGGDHRRQADDGAEDRAAEFFLVDPTRAVQPDRSEQAVPAVWLSGGLGGASR